MEKKQWQFRKSIKQWKIFSDDIGIQFIMEKYVKVIFKKGVQVKSLKITQDINTEITELAHNKTYKYLGINEPKGINQFLVYE